jgi:hypothetical protein
VQPGKLETLCGRLQQRELLLVSLYQAIVAREAERLRKWIGRISIRAATPSRLLDDKCKA